MNLERIGKSFGFLNDEELVEFANEYPQEMILVRCGNGRLTCPAQDAKHFIDIIKNSKDDYIRDVSLAIPTYNKLCKGKKS